MEIYEYLSKIENFDKHVVGPVLDDTVIIGLLFIYWSILYVITT